MDYEVKMLNFLEIAIVWTAVAPQWFSNQLPGLAFF